jgi:hypothetical protein
MSTQYRLVQSGKTASGGCSAGPRFVRACSATDLFIYLGVSMIMPLMTKVELRVLYLLYFGAQTEEEVQ